MIIVCLTCNITLPRRRGSRPDGARWGSNRGNVFRPERCRLTDSVFEKLVNIKCNGHLKHERISKKPEYYSNPQQ